MRPVSSHTRLPTEAHPRAGSGLGTSASTGCSTPSGVATHPIVQGVWTHECGVGQGEVGNSELSHGLRRGDIGALSAHFFTAD